LLSAGNSSNKLRSIRFHVHIRVIHSAALAYAYCLSVVGRGLFVFVFETAQQTEGGAWQCECTPALSTRGAPAADDDCDSLTLLLLALVGNVLPQPPAISTMLAAITQRSTTRTLPYNITRLLQCAVKIKGVSPAVLWDHAPRLNPSQTGRYSIYLLGGTGG